MKKMKFAFLLFAFVFGSAYLSSCKDCEIDPDLISDLLAPTTDIIAGEPVDWDYVVESIKDNTQDCEILKTVASFGKFAIDYFVDQNDPEGDLLFDKKSEISPLIAGQKEQETNRVDVFNNEGIYLIAVNADVTDVVKERNEDNNADNLELEQRSLPKKDLFENASPKFREKLANASAIVIVGHNFNNGFKVHSYKGKPIYYAE